MTTTKGKGFGLVSKNARDKAAEQATKTLNSVNASDNDNTTSTPPMEQSTSAPDPASPNSETVTPTVALAPEPAPSIVASVESAPSVVATSEPSISEPVVSEPATKPATTRKEGKNKKATDTVTAPLNAARVSPRAHKLLNMISSLENKTQSVIIDELIVLHPLYKKLKDLV